MAGVVVIGAGQAAASLVAKLRTQGYDGAITLLGEEPVPPYQRPPLSKQYLLKEMELERLFLRSESFYAEHDITLRLGDPVSAIDRAAKTVTVGASTIGYDQLALATGAIPRRLPAAIGGDLEGVYTVRTLADVDGMEHEFRPGRRALIVGGGYIGLEAAAVAAKLGLQVTLVEAADRILQRVAAIETSDFFRAVHRAHGVTIREGVGLERLTGQTRVSGAKLADGTEIKVDFVVVGIGIAPNTALAEQAGLAIDNGIATDAFGRTSDPAIWAAGDCASFPQRGGRIRLESVGNAIDMGELVAENMLGANREYVAKPWFWSDQYEVKLQIAGLNAGYDAIYARDDGMEGNQRSVSFWYYGKGELLAVDAMNDPRAYMIGKRLIEMGKTPDPAVIADPAADLKALLKG
jgi:3-phenylpropionate/trans-cinnamate dioxygenase ferredoxin reductase component